jgi:DNA modification methylase
VLFRSAEIPVAIATKPLDGYDIKSIELIENLHRRALPPADDLRLKHKLHLLQLERHGQSLGGAPNSEGWNQEKTAAMLGIDRSTLAKDLVLAQALDSFPELSDCKNKAEMNRVLKGMVRDYTNEVKAAEVDAKMSDGPKIQLCNSYVVGDFFEKEPALPANAFNFIEIDPPYGIDLTSFFGDKRGLSHSADNYTEKAADEYPAFLSELFRRCYRVAAAGCWGICWFSPEPWFETVYQAIVSAGFFCRRNFGFWLKPYNTSFCQNPMLLLSMGYDAFFYFRKGVSELQKPGRPSVYEFKQVPSGSKIHPAERPIEMYEELITTFVAPGARMLVPFVGSGNQLLAAANKRVAAVGYDLSEVYKNGFVVRVHEGDIGHYRSY